MDLYHKYRPTKFSEVVGQESAVQILSGFVKRGMIPHAILFYGPSGCGKTTLARILRKKLKCSEFDFSEINAADTRGIETIRDLRKTMRLQPMQGDSRVFLIDEAHKLTGDSQTALLKLLEDPPDTAWFFLCTTDPEKLLKTIRTRCSDIPLRALDEKELIALVQYVAGREGIKLESEVREKIAECADGSARKALVFLNSVQGLSKQEAIDAIQNSDERKDAIELARAIMFGKSWDKVADILRNVNGEPEQLRRMILSYARSVLLGSDKRNHMRAYYLIESFRDHFFDSGAAGLAATCFTAMQAARKNR